MIVRETISSKKADRNSAHCKTSKAAEFSAAFLMIEIVKIPAGFVQSAKFEGGKCVICYKDF